MSIIAFTGKGGVGKTTVSSLSLQWLVRSGRTPVLAIDADSNANLHEMLGVEFPETVGGIREEAKQMIRNDPGMSKQDFLDIKVQHALVECKGFDFLVMGRPEGPGCYCYANNVLRDVIARISSSYRHVIIDCEAGLEHISRRTLLEIDYLVTVSDPSLRGLRTASRISELLEELRTRVRHRALLINRMDIPGELTPEQQKVVGGGTFDRVFHAPADAAVSKMDSTGGSVESIPDTSPVRQAIATMMAGLTG